MFSLDPLGILAIVIAITIHEFSHAYVADRLGDPTPRLQGRVSLNPLTHLDLLGTLFLLLFRFGWGKPVQFDPFNLKNPRKDSALISLAGPASNFILAIVLSIILRLTNNIDQSILATIGTQLIFYNVLLGVFNFLPIAPLDGFKMVGGFLPHQQAKDWYSLERYGLIFLFLLIVPIGKGNMLSFIIYPIITFILSLLLPGGIIV